MLVQHGRDHWPPPLRPFTLHWPLCPPLCSVWVAQGWCCCRVGTAMKYTIGVRMWGIFIFDSRVHSIVSADGHCSLLYQFVLTRFIHHEGIFSIFPNLVYILSGVWSILRVDTGEATISFIHCSWLGSGTQLYHIALATVNPVKHSVYYMLCVHRYQEHVMDLQAECSMTINFPLVSLWLTLTPWPLAGTEAKCLYYNAYVPVHLVTLLLAWLTGGHAQICT